MKLLLTLILISTGVLAEDKVVKGYIKKNGHYVKAYHRSKKDKTPIDNYSTNGNLNPYTGKQGKTIPKKSLKKKVIL